MFSKYCLLDHKSTSPRTNFVRNENQWGSDKANEYTYLRQKVLPTVCIHEYSIYSIWIPIIKTVAPLLDLVCTCVKYKPLACYIIASHETEDIVLIIKASISIAQSDWLQYISTDAWKPIWGNSELLVWAFITVDITSIIWHAFRWVLKCTELVSQRVVTPFLNQDAVQKMSQYYRTQDLMFDKNLTWYVEADEQLDMNMFSEPPAWLIRQLYPDECLIW